MGIKTIYEFLVWDNCNNNCKFCFQRLSPNIYTLQEQKNTLNNVIKFIQSENFEHGSHILICGGELFDNNERIDFFQIFFEKLLFFVQTKRVDLIYINTNLIYNKAIINSLYLIFKKFYDAKLINHIRFTTSYDIYGRFSTINKHNQFLENLQYIKQLIPFLNIVVNIILTKQFCNAILNNDIDINTFCKKYDVQINLIPYIILDHNLIPTQQLLYNTLQHIYSQNHVFFKQWLNELDLKQKRVMLLYKNNDFLQCDCSLLSCGHSENFKRYTLKANSCFVCDIKYLFNFII